MCKHEYSVNVHVITLKYKIKTFKILTFNLPSQFTAEAKVEKVTFRECEFRFNQALSLLGQSDHSKASYNYIMDLQGMDIHAFVN